ncbi:hypothetical protein N0V93_008651 [Gnomoniopsis smithogilvyi]|uniref:Secreted protein n=1 Tax=Gnomoniopsis smithogilvyi TaxID=1191159 RepID=A0A9W8YN51_9PEZI|nr:hypothetical protein N0V93_008651 [Gnomoniopsis smithogilvyi]
MQLSTILLGTLAVFATAHVARSAEPEPAEIQDIVKQISEFPGLGAIQGMFKCIKKDRSWKVDYSDKKNGKVTFSSVTEKCCEKAQAGWTKYGKHWGKFAQATFDQPCTGGQLSSMTEDHINKLQAMIGNGH